MAPVVISVLLANVPDVLLLEAFWRLRKVLPLDEGSHYLSLLFIYIYYVEREGRNEWTSEDV